MFMYKTGYVYVYIHIIYLVGYIIIHVYIKTIYTYIGNISIFSMLHASMSIEPVLCMNIYKLESIDIKLDLSSQLAICWTNHFRGLMAGLETCRSG